MGEDLYFYENIFRSKGYRYIAGVDEAGRGPLAGPVIAAAVILPEKEKEMIEGIKDSKKLTEKRREILYEELTKKALCWSVGIVDEKTIDRINILNATLLAMRIAISKLSIKPEVLLIDALRIPEVDIPQESIIKGDNLSVSIAAASIIAKVTRDRIMYKYHEKFPIYNFNSNKGYGTAQHIEAIRKYGLSPIHRLTFTKKFIGIEKDENY